MADQDDVISAMWCSLVPPTPTEDVRAETAEPTMDFSMWNDGGGGVLEVGSNHAEAGQLIVHPLPPQYYHDETVDYYWNRHRMVQNYPQDEEVSTEAATVVDMQTLSDSIEDAKPMAYWNQEEIMVQGYPEHEETFADEDMPAADVESLFCHTAAECSHHPPRPDSVFVAAEVNHTKTEQGPDHPTLQDVPAMMIYRAPETRSRESMDPYKPQFIQIGPYYGDQARSQVDQKFKDHFVNKIIEMNRNVPRKRYEQKIKDEEAKVKKYYDDSISKVASHPLAVSLTSAACTILGLLGDVAASNQELGAKMEAEPDQLDQEKLEDQTEFDDKEEMGYVPSLSENTNIEDLVQWSFRHLAHDIILMGNQIPFFIVEVVYDLAIGNKPGNASFLRSKMVKFLHQYILKPYPTALTPTSEATYNFQYILHYCHMHFKPQVDERTVPVDVDFIEWYGATELYNSGVKFKRISKHSNRSLLDIKFNDGVLEIPTLMINDKTNLLFHNIVAYERLLHRSDSSNKYFTSYIRFMNALLARPLDVTFLARKKIIQSHFGKEAEIIKLFKTLMEGGTTTSDADSYLRPVYFKLNEHYRSPFNKWFVDLKKKYFQTPRLIVAWGIGALVLACTIIGAVYNVKGHVIVLHR